jgi:hypothetical protein
MTRTPDIVPLGRGDKTGLIESGRDRTDVQADWLELSSAVTEVVRAKRAAYGGTADEADVRQALRHTQASTVTLLERPLGNLLPETTTQRRQRLAVQADFGSDNGPGRPGPRFELPPGAGSTAPKPVYPRSGSM